MIEWFTAEPGLVLTWGQLRQLELAILVIGLAAGFLLGRLRRE